MEKKFVELQRIVRTYYGIEYALVLFGPEGKYYEDRDVAMIADDLYWCVEYTDKSGKLARRTSKDTLWWDTISWKDKRMSDKYRQCEIRAVLDINWMLSNEYIKIRGKQVFSELYYFFYVIAATFPKRVLFAIKKLIGTQS